MTFLEKINQSFREIPKEVEKIKDDIRDMEIEGQIDIAVLSFLYLVGLFVLACAFSFWVLDCHDRKT